MMDRNGKLEQYIEVVLPENKVSYWIYFWVTFLALKFGREENNIDNLTLLSVSADKGERDGWNEYR